MRMVWAGLVLAACSTSGEAIKRRTEGATAIAGAKLAEPPLRVEIGDCALPAASFVSGPRPMPFVFETSELKAMAAEPASTARVFGAGSESDDINTSIYSPFTEGSFSGGAVMVFAPGGGRVGDGLAAGTDGEGTVERRTGPTGNTSIGQPDVQGDLNKAIVRRYMKRNQQKIVFCYEKELAAHPKLAGTVTTQFTITPLGQVADAKATGVSSAVSSCLQRVIADIEFPKPQDGRSVVVRYPIVFWPDEAEPQQNAPSAPGPAVAPAPPAAPPAAPYVPGAESPLRGHETALAACLRKQPRPYGVLVVDLAPKARGTEATVHGLEGHAARDCIVSVARELAKQVARAQRCPVAFGELPVADAPAVEITANELRWLGKRLVGTAEIAAADERKLIDALYSAAFAYAEETTAATATVALRGPIVLRALDATPMKVVTQVVGTMAWVSVDLVPARRTPTGWKLLRRVGPLPVVPVPAGTGRSWNHREHLRENVRPELWIFVAAEKIQVGTSKPGELVEISSAGAGPDLGQLERVLATHKRTRFIDREELEVYAEDKVPYGNVALILELADKIGFPYARIVDPRATSLPRR